MRVELRALLVSGVLLGSISTVAQTKPTVEVVADLLERFNPAQVRDSSSCAVRRPAVAGGVKQNGLFEHPQTTGTPARVLYDINLPKVESGELLLFAFSVGIADGAKLDGVADGVRFAIDVDGARVFSEDWKENRWRDAAIDLTPLAGRRIQLVLLTGALGNTSYDWALWGNPRVLHFKGTSSSIGHRVNAGIGAVAVSPVDAAETTVRLKPFGKGDPMVWRIPGDASSTTTNRWFAFDFVFPESNGMEMSWEPEAALNSERVKFGAYPAQPRLIRVSPAQSVARPGESLGVNVEVKNEGRGRLDGGVAQVRLHVGTNVVPAPLTIPALPPGETWRGQWSWAAPKRPGRWPVQAELSMVGDAAREQVETNLIVLSSAIKSAVLESEDFSLELFGLGTDSSYARLYHGKGGRFIGVWSPLMRAVVETANGPVDWKIPLTLPKRRSAAGVWILEARGVKDPAGGVWDGVLKLRKEPGRPLVRIHCELTPRQDSRIRAFWGPNIYVGDGTTGDGKTWGLFPGLEYLYGPEPSSNPRDFAPPLHDRRSPHPQKYTIPLMAVTVGRDSRNPPPTPERFYTPDSFKDSTLSIQSVERNLSHSDPLHRKSERRRISVSQSPNVSLDDDGHRQLPLLGGEDQGEGGPTNDAARRSSTGNGHSETTLALWWDPLQKWDGRNAFPSPRFASPNFDEGMENQRIGLFIPSVPDSVVENSDRSSQPVQLRAGEELSLECTLMMTSEPVMSAVREWIQDRGGLPSPNPWLRSYQEELDVCRAGFLKTIWDEKNEKWRHCVDWASSHAPGFAALLWMDSKVAENIEARNQSRDRVELAAKNMLRDGGPALFASQANCHIMQWEFPFLYGCLPEAMSALEGQIQQLIQTQRPDGGWIYEPAGKEQTELGQAGDSVLGTCANRAATILRYARITGDTNALAAGVKALEFMERFRVPRGGQTWECPMYEPDILAAAYAIKACVDGYRATGNPRWLHDAVYWAETGVPFIYLWSLPDKPMMLGATIPVFGSTFYTHSWLGVPVQWCGLVYAYHVWHLAQELERMPLITRSSTPRSVGAAVTRLKYSGDFRTRIEPPHVGSYIFDRLPMRDESPLPLSLNFSSADWKRIVELITVSGMYQQFADGPRIGAYPDSISQFEKRNPAFINPEDILVNVLALKGYDPDVKTARVRTDRGETVVSSGAHVSNLNVTPAGVSFRLDFFRGEPSHTLVSGIKPREVLVNGARLLASQSPVRRDAGWWWDPQRGRIYLTVLHDGTETNEVEIVR